MLPTSASPTRVAPRAWLSLVAAAVLLPACAAIPIAEDPIDWDATCDRWSIHVVTFDPDGGERVTRIWIGRYGESAAVRGGSGRWAANLRRNPDLFLRVDGRDHPMRADFVDDDASIEAIDVVFRAKYGWQERTFFFGATGRDAHDHFIVLVPRV